MPCKVATWRQKYFGKLCKHCACCPFFFFLLLLVVFFLSLLSLSVSHTHTIYTSPPILLLRFYSCHFSWANHLQLCILSRSWKKTNLVGAGLWTEQGLGSLDDLGSNSRSVLYELPFQGSCVTWPNCVLSCLSYPTVWAPMDHSSPGSSVHGILQARTPETVAMPSSKGSSGPRDWTHVSYISYIGRWVLYHQGHLGSLGKLHSLYKWHNNT